MWTDVNARIFHCDCVEMEIDHPNGLVRVSVNGQETSKTPFGTLPAFDTLQIGPSAQATALPLTEQLWIDDVAYNDKPIGCTR
jgi:hypothetical protein